MIEILKFSKYLKSTFLQHAEATITYKRAKK